MAEMDRRGFDKIPPESEDLYPEVIASPAVTYRLGRRPLEAVPPYSAI